MALSSTATVVPLGKGERTAARIRDIALDQFSRLGFERVTMAGIAEAAGVSQASLHHHFGDKDQLWRAAMLGLANVIAEEERLLAAAQDASAIVQLRMAMRLFTGAAPRIAPAIPLWQHRLAQGMHVALYVFMLGMPLLGWFAVSAKGDPVLFFGMQLPALLGPDKTLYRSLKDIHETIGTVGYYLIGLYAAAALFHHYVPRDNTLLRMLPVRR